MNSSKENSWLLIRTAGLIISIYAIYQLIGIAFIAYSIQEQLKKMNGNGLAVHLENQLHPLVILPVLLYLSFLLFGIYCLRGGAFFHRLLCYSPKQNKNKPSRYEKEHSAELSPSNVTENPQRSEPQRELYFQFLRNHPEINELAAKDKHVAFREWQESHHSS